MDERPKRRKNKDNPYELISYTKQDNKEYLVAFKDVNGEYKKLKVSEEVFLAFNQFELDDLKIMNEYDRHIEHTKLTEEQLHNRKINNYIELDEQIIRKRKESEFIKEIWKLRKPQNRRVYMYFIKEYKMPKIARIEGCTVSAISQSISIGIKKLKKFKKFLK